MSEETKFETRALSSLDGEKWSDRTNPQVPFPDSEDSSVSRLVIGQLDKGKSITPADWLLNLVQNGGLKQRFPALKCLHLWGIDNLETLGALPSDLVELDVRNCYKLETVSGWSSTLEILVVKECIELSRLPEPPVAEASHWLEVDIDGSEKVSEVWIKRMLQRSKKLRILDISRNGNLETIAAWSPDLVDARFNKCPKLRSIEPIYWPKSLRRLEFVKCPVLETLPAFYWAKDCFTENLEYIDLRGSSRLADVDCDSLVRVKRVIDENGEASVEEPEAGKRLRTLFAADTRLKFSPGTVGSDPNRNIAKMAFADRYERAFGSVEDNGVKVILLGNGRCGKTSLVRRWLDKDFSKDEDSTHGIRLLNKELSFDSKEGECKTAKVQVWDFAGQDLYHNTHRLFFQSRAVFVLCYTEAGPGADEKGDEEARRTASEKEDIKRPLRYWREQIRSLGIMPGIGEPPPIILVKTKTDREKEEEADLSGMEDLVADQLELSAVEKGGARNFESRIKEEISKVLGTLEQREIGRRTDEVREKVQELIDLNNAQKMAGQEESENKEGKTDTPFISIATFKGWVKKFCPNGPYAEDPKLLLEVFHRSGLVYAGDVSSSRSIFLEEIILDQVWVIGGIYAALKRGSNWNQICHRDGRFLCSELAVRVWERRGYSDEHQRLFIQFMQDCQICFRISYEYSDREAEYMLPEALPGLESNSIRLALEDRIRGLEMAGEARFEVGTTVGKEAMLAVFAELGRGWGEVGVYWKWGGLFKYYPEQGDSRRESPAVVRFDWEELKKDDYEGTLKATLYGTNKAYFSSLLERLEGTPYFRERGLRFDGERVDVETGQNIAHDAASSVKAKCCRVSISYKGLDSESALTLLKASGKYNVFDTYDADEIWRKLSSQEIKELDPACIELRPRWLREVLKANELISHVEDYRREQCRPDYEKTDNIRKDYLDKLVDDCDLFVAFLTQEYYQSEYCMYEYWKARTNLESDRSDRGFDKKKKDPAILALVGCESSAMKANAKGFIAEPKIVEHAFGGWIMEQVTRLDEKALKDFEYRTAGLNKTHDDFKKDQACRNWIDYAKSPERIESIKVELKDWNNNLVPNLCTEVHIRRVAGKIVENMKPDKSLKKYAKNSWLRAQSLDGEERSKAEEHYIELFKEAIKSEWGVDSDEAFLDFMRNSDRGDYGKWPLNIIAAILESEIRRRLGRT